MLLCYIESQFGQQRSAIVISVHFLVAERAKVRFWVSPHTPVELYVYTHLSLEYMMQHDRIKFIELVFCLKTAAL